MQFCVLPEFGLHISIFIFKRSNPDVFLRFYTECKFLSLSYVQCNNQPPGFLENLFIDVQSLRYYDPIVLKTSDMLIEEAQYFSITLFIRVVLAHVWFQYASNIQCTQYCLGYILDCFRRVQT